MYTWRFLASGASAASIRGSSKLRSEKYVGTSDGRTFELSFDVDAGSFDFASTQLDSGCLGVTYEYNVDGTIDLPSTNAGKCLTQLWDENKFSFETIKYLPVEDAVKISVFENFAFYDIKLTPARDRRRLFAFNIFS